jgi:hypothetical protein
MHGFPLGFPTTLGRTSKKPTPPPLEETILLALLVPGAMAAIFFQVGRAVAEPPLASAVSSSVASDDLQAFAALEPIDTHVHAFKTDLAITDLFVRLHLRVLDICVADSQRSFGGLAAETARARELGTSQPKSRQPLRHFRPVHIRAERFCSEYGEGTPAGVC